MTDSIMERHNILSADVTADAVFYEYSKAANPIGAKIISRVPYHTFPASLYESGESRVIPLDLSDILNCVGPATGPGVLANFVRINGGDRIVLNPLATSQIVYVIDGFGVAEQDGKNIPLDKGAFLAFPGGISTTLKAVTTLKLYYVNDAPLLAYLGVGQVTPRFSATLYGAERAEEELRKAAADKDAANRSRISVLLGNKHFPQTRTVTHVLWAMFGTLPGNSVQKPHRHQSIALDFIVDCPQGCYSLVGTKLDEQGNIADATRVDWEPGMSFVTPPGYWHAHINESSEAAKLIPIQDAGLQTWLRSLDIRFS
ncbi:TPA: hypothetical protein ACTV62_000625 [Klebsiella michiganensis]